MPMYNLLNGQVGATGAAPAGAFYLGRTKPPYTIRTGGTYTTTNVTIDTSIVGEYVNGSTPTGTVFTTDFGWLGSASDPVEQPGTLSALPNNETVVIDHPVKFIRATFGGDAANTATVQLYTEE